MTIEPLAPSSMQIACPIPDDPPVTIATLLLKSSTLAPPNLYHEYVGRRVRQPGKVDRQGQQSQDHERSSGFHLFLALVISYLKRKSTT